MNIKDILLDKKSLIILVILLLGLVLAVYLVQQRQIFKPKASQQIYNAFEITEQDQNGQEKRVACTGNECTVDSLNLKIKIDPSQLETP